MRPGHSRPPVTPVTNLGDRLYSLCAPEEGWACRRAECPLPTCGRPGCRRGRPAHMMDNGTHRTGGVDASRAALSTPAGRYSRLATPHWLVLAHLPGRPRPQPTTCSRGPTNQPTHLPLYLPESAPSSSTYQRPLTSPALTDKASRRTSRARRNAPSQLLASREDIKRGTSGTAEREVRSVGGRCGAPRHGHK